MRPKLNCKRCRSVTVSDQKGLITRRKKKHQGCTAEQQCLFPACITPLNTGCLYMQCDKTSSILNFCLCGCLGGGGQDWGMGVGGMAVGFWQWPDGGMSDNSLSSLRSTTVCLQDSMQPSAGSPHPPSSPPPHPRPSTHPLIRMLL